MHDLVVIAGFFALGLSPCLIALRLTDEEREARRRKDPESASLLRS
jgi:hypothetical protein